MLIAAFYDKAFFQQFARRLRASAIFLGIKCELFKRAQAADLGSLPTVRGPRCSREKTTPAEARGSSVPHGCGAQDGEGWAPLGRRRSETSPP